MPAIEAVTDKSRWVEGHEYANEDSFIASDGEFAPFRIFDVNAQDYLPGIYPDRATAESALIALEA